MARKKQAVKPVVPETYTYTVTSDAVEKFLGPHKVRETDGGQRTVQLTASQAKYYLDQGVIAPAE